MAGGTSSTKFTAIDDCTRLRGSQLPERGARDQGRTGPGTDDEERPGGEEPVTYCRYRIRIPNKSITNPNDRDSAWKLVATLQRLLDPAREEYDHQLIQLDLMLTTAQGHVGDLEQRARDADARWDVEEEDF